MKKIYTVLIILLGLILISGCQNKKPNPKVIDNAFYDAGLNHSYIIYDRFYHAPGSFAEYSPADETPGSEFQGSAALWSYGAVLTMLAAGSKLNPELEFFKEKTEDILLGLKEFRMPRATLHYSAINGAGGEPYYDDNAWVVIGLYDLAKARNDKELMAHSRELLDYVLSGESEEGGIYWKETTSSRNTCSSGPAIVGALLHYLENPDEEQELLDIALRIYSWTKRVLRDPSDFVYWDNATYNHETKQEEIVKWKFTYNSGTMIWAAALLHQITKEQAYLDDANMTAEGSLGLFYRELSGRSFYPRTPWFNLYLLRGYIELAKTYDNGSKDYLVNTFKTNLRYALLNGVDKDGILLPTWGNGQNLSTDKYVKLLETAASTEVLFLLADFELNIQKEK